MSVLAPLHVIHKSCIVLGQLALVVLGHLFGRNKCGCSDDEAIIRLSS